MFIRMLIGGRAGEIMDVREEAAHRLIQNGDAENPYAEQPAVVLADSAAAAREPKDLNSARKPHGADRRKR